MRVRAILCGFLTLVAIQPLRAGDFYRSSEMQLDGDAAPRTTEFDFRALPTGEYTVTATLFGANGKQRAFLRQQVVVVSNG